MSQRSLFRLVVATIVIASLHARASVAQVVRTTIGVSTPGTGTTQQASNVDVAVGADGILAFVLEGSPVQQIYARRFTAEGSFLGQSRIDEGHEAVEVPALAAAAGGGYLASWSSFASHVIDILARRLDHLTAGVGSAFPVVDDFHVRGIETSIAALPQSWVVVWSEERNLYARRFNAAGAPISGKGLIDAGAGPFHDVVALPSGGYLAGWYDFASREAKARAYSADGVARGEALVVVADLLFSRLAVSDLGVAAVVGLRQVADPAGLRVVVRLFDPLAGVPLADEIAVADLSGVDLAFPDVGFDLSGNLYVVWGDTRIGPGGIFAQGFDAGGAALGPAVRTSIVSPYYRVRTARLADGSFVNAWVSQVDYAFANVVSLCDPASAVCGDGVLVSTCERCDDGVANSDTTPDACRTTCQLPHCGDGVIDSGEACDDGNTANCDGCSASCHLESGLTCGDGMVSPPECGEQCDDGNAIEGDGCSPQCKLERIPGGGSPRTDCDVEWLVDNPANVPLRDARGHYNLKQTCVDDDPRCDFDGGVPGSCTFHVEVCASGTDLAGCTPAGRLASWTLDKPTAKQAATKPLLAAVRAAFASSVPSEIVGPAATDFCSGIVPVVLPLRSRAGGYGKAKLTLAASARLYDGTRDRDKLSLTCLPIVGS